MKLTHYQAVVLPLRLNRIQQNESMNRLIKLLVLSLMSFICVSQNRAQSNANISQQHGVILSRPPQKVDTKAHYLFYLSGYIVEAGNIRPTSPRFGVYEYEQILDTFKQSGFVVISEARKRSPEIEPYAAKVAAQVKQLLNARVPPQNITVVGASQGPPLVSATRPGKVATYYNAEKNSTTVVLGLSDVGGESPCGLYISANASHPGKTAAPPSSVNFVILRITPEEKITSAPLRDLTFTADGQVLNLGVMETGSQQSNMGLRFETLQISVPYESFLKIANARKVECKLGPGNFMLTENNLKFIREFVGRMKS